jgi:hypothetical protein
VPAVDRANPNQEPLMAKYLVLSDLHLGQNGQDRKGEYSLLSRISADLPDEKAAADAALARLQAALTTFARGERVTLVVAGDLLDLSLAYLGDALGDLGVLLAQLPEIDRLAWVVGNHDHHVWMLHCEEKHLLAPLRAGGAAWVSDLSSPSPGGNGQPDPGAIYRPTAPGGEPLTIVQQALADAAGRPLEVLVAYPALRLSLTDQRPGLPDNLKQVLCYVTHGHLFGGLYTLLSDILAKRLVGLPREQVAATVNLPLIELIYWLLGETGEGMGANGLVEAVYTDLQRGDTSSARELIADVIGTLVDGDTLKRIVQAVADFIAKRVLPRGNALPSGDRHAATAGTRAGVQRWCADAELVRLPRVTVVYGHTHVGDTHSVPGTGVLAYNLGSWLVEPGFPVGDTYALQIDDGPPQLHLEWIKL